MSSVFSISAKCVLSSVQVSIPQLGSGQFPIFLWSYIFSPVTVMVPWQFLGLWHCLICGSVTCTLLKVSDTLAWLRARGLRARSEPAWSLWLTGRDKTPQAVHVSLGITLDNVFLFCVKWTLHQRINFTSVKWTWSAWKVLSVTERAVDFRTILERGLPRHSFYELFPSF